MKLQGCLFRICIALCPLALSAAALRTEHPISVMVFVHSGIENPIEGATVYLSLPRFGTGEVNGGTQTTTNEIGIARLAGVARHAYQVSVEMDGYYRTTMPLRYLTSLEEIEKYARGEQGFSVHLREIRHPTASIVKYVDHLRIPEFGKPLGFDLEKGDWVRPAGVGVHSDFILELNGAVKSGDDYDYSLSLSFPNSLDGLLSVPIDPQHGSTFKWPYEAPPTGYESTRIWKASPAETTFSRSDDFVYIFRVRSEVDDRKKLKRALYGLVSGEFRVRFNRAMQPSLSFVYKLNPDWSPNLEFDDEKAVRAGTGQLLVQPPPK